MMKVHDKNRGIFISSLVVLLLFSMMTLYLSHYVVVRFMKNREAIVSLPSIDEPLFVKIIKYIDGDRVGSGSGGIIYTRFTSAVVLTAGHVCVEYNPSFAEISENERKSILEQNYSYSGISQDLNYLKFPSGRILQISLQKDLCLLEMFLNQKRFEKFDLKIGHWPENPDFPELKTEIVAKVNPPSNIDIFYGDRFVNLLGSTRRNLCVIKSVNLNNCLIPKPVFQTELVFTSEIWGGVSGGVVYDFKNKEILGVITHRMANGTPIGYSTHKKDIYEFLEQFKQSSISE